MELYKTLNRKIQLLRILVKTGLRNCEMLNGVYI